MMDPPHACHWPTCRTRVSPSLWGCSEHWFALPKRLRDKIWAAYEPGQETRKDPSPAYIEAALEVQTWIVSNCQHQFQIGTPTCLKCGALSAKAAHGGNP